MNYKVVSTTELSTLNDLNLINDMNSISERTYYGLAIIKKLGVYPLFDNNKVIQMNMDNELTDMWLSILKKIRLYLSFMTTDQLKLILNSFPYEKSPYSSEYGFKKLMELLTRFGCFCNKIQNNTIQSTCTPVIKPNNDFADSPFPASKGPDITPEELIYTLQTLSFLSETESDQFVILMRVQNMVCKIPINVQRKSQCKYIRKEHIQYIEKSDQAWNWTESLIN